MKKPTLDQVARYCRDRGNNIDPEAFFDYYEMIGWVCGRTKKPMKNWQAAVRTWERNNKGRYSKGIQKTRHNNFQTSIKDQAAALGMEARPGETWDDFAIRVRARAH